MRRISPLHSKTGLFGWFFLVEAVLGFLHLGEFSMSFVQGVFGWMQIHFFVDLFIGLGLLFIRVEWPSIEPRIPSWLRFRTLHDRVHLIEGKYNTFGERLDALEKSIASYREAIPTLQEGYEAITDHELRLINMEEHGKVNRPLLEALKNSVIGLPSWLVRVLDVHGALRDAKEILMEYAEIRMLFPSSPVSANPFLDWRPLIGDPC